METKEGEKASASSASKLGCINVDRGTWWGGAQEVCDKLNEKRKALAADREGKKSLRVISIDAHNTGPDGNALFTAIYAEEDATSLNLPIVRFTQQNSLQDYDQQYRKALEFAHIISQLPASRSPRLIGVTSSCNSGNKKVTTVFYEVEGASAAPIATSTESKTSSATLDGPLRVMSLNIWCNGGDSMSDTIEVIRRSQADVVGLQECTDVDLVAAALDFYCHPSSSIISRYPIISATEAAAAEAAATRAAGDQSGALASSGASSSSSSSSASAQEHQRKRQDYQLGARVLLPQVGEVLCFNVHTTAYPYPPYQLRVNGASPASAAHTERITQVCILSLNFSLRRNALEETKLKYPATFAYALPTYAFTHAVLLHAHMHTCVCAAGESRVAGPARGAADRARRGPPGLFDRRLQRRQPPGLPRTRRRHRR